MKAGASFVFAKLFRFQCMNFWHFNPFGDYEDFTYTDAAFPIFINKYQAFATGTAQLGPYSHGSVVASGLTFAPDTMSCGTLEYATGFEDKPLEVNWPIDDTVDHVGSGGTSLAGAVSPVNLTLKQAFSLGAFSECPFWVHLAIFDKFPQQGGVLLGTTLMFRGFIRTVTTTRISLKIGVASLMDVFQNVQIPTQTITPNDRSIPYAPGAPGQPGMATTDGIVVNSPTSLTLSSTFGTYTMALDALRDNWLIFYPNSGVSGLLRSGLPPPALWRIRGNDAASSGSITIYFYEPPVVPPGVYFISVFGQSSLIGGGSAPGFPFVPPPEVSTP